MDTQNKIKHLVIDTTGFIRNPPLQEMAESMYTTPSVVKEITSKAQIRRLVVLPYDLNVKEPFPEHVAHVTEFAKKTGDYASLSATDIQVMALTYQLEKENIGVDHLKVAPAQRPLLIPGGLPCQDLKDVVGFYFPKDDEKEISSDLQDVTEEIDTETQDVDNLPKEENCSSLEGDGNDKEDEGWYDCDEDGEDINDNDEDDDGWITPSNIKELKERFVSQVNEQNSPEVACLTTDFAMQNVLKQIGLSVVALDGRIIKELRTFILRCYGCFKTTSVMSKVFCPNCGNKTLKKVAVSTNPDGTQQIHINFRKPLTARGKRYSLPTPKGGKHANNPILCEDQPLPQQRISRLSRTKNNPLEDDYIAGFSPFVTRDVSSRSAMLGIRQHAQIKQSMRKNPNESVKPGGRKRK